MSEVKRRGRPPGSKNKEYVEAMEIPATCPACGSANMKAVRGNAVSVMDYAGNYDGFEYSRVEWHDKVCECGQRVRVRRFLP